MTKTNEYIAHSKSPNGQQSLEAHLWGVSTKAGSFAEKLGLKHAGELIGLLHDLGKYSEKFQIYLKSAAGILNQDEDEEFVDAKKLKGTIDHSSAGAQFIWQHLGAQAGLSQIVGQMLALCIASHHSGLIDCLSAESNSFGDDVFNRRMNKLDERTHLKEACSKLDSAIKEQAQALLFAPELINEIQTMLKSIVLANPAKSDKGFVAQQQIGLLVRLLFSCLIDADRLDTAIFEKPKDNAHRQAGDYTAWPILIERLEQKLASMDQSEGINHIRRDIAAHCLDGAQRAKGMFTLSVPTGGGKTLASLRFALNHAKHHKMDRIIYVIPFTSIIDQNASVVREILEPQGEVTDNNRVVLEHHANLTADAQGWRDKILTENWDAPVIYTTMVQFLETLFGAGTRGARRMHQLANSVLIFDEVQSLPIRCTHLFNNAINFLVDSCGSTAVLCTATQPLLDKVSAEKGAIKLTAACELMPDVAQLFTDLKRVEVLNRIKPGGWAEDEITALALEEIAKAGSCLVIVNTKKAAQRLYQLAKPHMSDSVFHLSTSLCPAHRKKILSGVCQKLKDKQTVLCISTQLIEAGVDVDFGAVIRYAAGLDSIAQAAGRCNRHKAREVGYVHVVNPRPEDESLDKLPDILQGREKAERVLADYAANPQRFDSDLLGRKAMDWYYENYFYARAKDMCYPVFAKEKWHNIGHDDSLLNLLSDNALASTEYGQRNGSKPTMYLRQSFMTAAIAFKAIDSPTQGVIVPYGIEGKEIINDLCGAWEVDKQFDLLRRAQQFSVNVFSHQLDKLQKAGAVHTVQPESSILYLDKRYYSAEFGLVTEPIGLMENYNV